MINPCKREKSNTSCSGSKNILIKEEIDIELGPGLDLDEETDVNLFRWDVEIESRISLDLNLFVCMACSGSKYSSKEKLNIITHIRTKHLKDFSGYVCELCPQIFNSQGRFERHMKISHNVLTVSRNTVKTEESIAE